MNCSILTKLFLRANGQFACGCDAGNEISLGEASAKVDWSADKLFRGRGYAIARAMFRQGYAPWPECAGCYFLQPQVPVAAGRPGKWISEVFFEPSFACALRCPSCPRAAQASTRPGPTLLAMDIWRRFLSSLFDEGYCVGSFISSGLGDPLTHPRLEEMIESIREFFPTTPITVNTHANFRFTKTFARGVYPDRLLVSVDGLYQSSYEKYRINGEVAMALEFMRAARRVPGQRPAVEWKYILFRHNDSDEELVATQRKAEELNVDSLQFVFTHTVEKSTRYTPENAQDVPIIWGGCYLDATSQLRFHRREAIPLSPNNSDGQPGFAASGRVHIAIDSCQQWSDRLLVRGWAMGKDGSTPRRIEIYLESTIRTEARVGLVREDVWRAFPARGNRTGGFDAMVALPTSPSTVRFTLVLIYHSIAGDAIRFAVDYDLGLFRAASTKRPIP